jgi:glycosyltransferase involved in cell wall biosynthesis
MRILYLLYNQQNSVEEFSKNPKISLSWVDALMSELVKCENVSIALAVPVTSKNFQKSQKLGISFYGLPDTGGDNIFKKAYKRLTHDTENIEVNSCMNQIIDDFDPDIIQIFGSENPFGLIIKEVKKPVIIHIQGYLLVWEGKWFTGVSKWDQFRYSSLKDLLLMRGTFNDFFAFRKRAKTEEVILKNCNYYMGRTNFDKRIALLISPESKYFHCEEFIRREFFDKEWNNFLRKEITCISTLKATSYKGVDLLFEVSRILKRYSKFTFKFKICGVSENEGYIRLIKKKFKTDFNSLNIEFLGKLSANDLVNQLCNSDFYIHPSYIENSPNSICEAMATGVPIIATNVGGVSTLIEDQLEGILTQEGEPFSLAGAIVELALNYDKARELGRNARIRAFKRHQPDVILENLLKIYNEIIYDNGRKDIS